MSEFLPLYKKLLKDPVLFVRHASKISLRKYQRGVIEAIFDSVIEQRGLSFVVIFPRQSGKNELQAQLEAYLLTLFSMYPVEMIKVSPTLMPQALNAMRRFERVARKNMLIEKVWTKEAGSSYRVGDARLTFLSGAPESNIVGATASGLLEVDEAQDVTTLKYDREVAPMSASVCATRVFWGTSWTSQTLLSREQHSAIEAEKRDGLRRVFKLSAEDVMAEVSAYRQHVEEAVTRLGRAHPLVRTQYFSEEIDGQGGMFPPDRIARMRTIVPTPTTCPQPGRLYALLLDVAGEDEGARGIEGGLTLSNPARDASALTLVEVRFGDDLQHAADSSEPNLPVYTPVRRWQWIGVNHASLHTALRAIALEWNARAVVVDATGVGAGLASFLERALPGRITPFSFNSTSKSQLGWDFLGVVDSGRWREPDLSTVPGAEQSRFQQEFFDQLATCQFEVLNTPAQRMRWGVPDGARNLSTGEPIHDDWVLSAALCAVLETMDWHTSAPSLIISAPDPLKEMDGKY
jgi:hypothetical protein